jgi:hypothetical protein
LKLKILKKIDILYLDMDLIFKEEPVLCYLDAYLYTSTGALDEELAAFNSKSLIKSEYPMRPLEILVSE